jgi:cytoskeletal protein RodZ
MEMENNNFAHCGGDTYARGHLRNIAAKVGIDPQVFIDLYNEEHSTEHRAIQDLLAENNVMQLPQEQKKISWKVPATVSLAILLVIGVVQIVISNQSSTTPSAPQAEVTQSASPTASAAVAQSPTPSTSATTPTRSGPITLSIVAARGNSYIDIVVDGKHVSKGSLFQGDSKSFKGDTAISIYLSNPAGLDLTLNGKALAPLGGQNEEVRRTFR